MGIAVPIFAAIGKAIAGAVGAGAASGTVGAAGATAATGIGLGSGLTAGSVGLMEAGAAAAGLGVSGGATASTLSLGSILSVSGLGLSALGQIQQGRALGEVAEANAKAAAIDAKQKQEAAKSDTLQLSRERRRMIGTQAAMLGGGGMDVSGGSPLDILLDTTREFERDIQMRGYLGDIGASGSMYEASLNRLQGKNARKSGWMGAGTSLLSGAGRMMSKKGGLFASLLE